MPGDQNVYDVFSAHFVNTTNETRSHNGTFRKRSKTKKKKNY